MDNKPPFPFGNAPANLTQIFNTLQNIVQAINLLQQTTADIFTGGLTSSKTWAPTSLTTGSQQTTTVTCAGASLGQAAQGAFSLDLQGLILTAYVSAANTVTVVLYNNTGGTVALSSGLLKVWVHS